MRSDAGLSVNQDHRIKSAIEWVFKLTATKGNNVVPAVIGSNLEAKGKEASSCIVHAADLKASGARAAT